MQRMFNRHPWLWRVVLGLLILYAAIGILDRRSAPVEVLSAEISPLVAHAGEPVRVRFRVDRNRICPTTIISYWEQGNDDPTPIRLPVRSRTIPQLGRNLTVDVPDLTAPMQLGQQCYRSRVIHHCNPDEMVVSPPVCLTVVPPKEP